MQDRIFLDGVEKDLRAPLPGIPAQLRMVPEPRPQGHKIWGATAMVLAEFLALLESSRHEDSP